MRRRDSAQVTALLDFARRGRSASHQYGVVLHDHSVRPRFINEAARRLFPSSAQRLWLLGTVYLPQVPDPVWRETERQACDNAAAE